MRFAGPDGVDGDAGDGGGAVGGAVGGGVGREGSREGGARGGEFLGAGGEGHSCDEGEEEALHIVRFQVSGFRFKSLRA